MNQVGASTKVLSFTMGMATPTDCCDFTSNAKLTVARSKNIREMALRFLQTLAPRILLPGILADKTEGKADDGA